MTATVGTDPPAPRPQWERDDDFSRPALRSPSGPGPDRRRTVLVAAVAGVLGAAAIGAVITNTGSDTDSLATVDTPLAEGDATTDAAGEAAASGIEGAAAAGDTDDGALPDLIEDDLGQNQVEPDDEITESERADGGCTIGALSIRAGDTGEGVECLQQALIESGYLDGSANGTFDDATTRAVMSFQEDESLFVDGVVGRESAIELDIWPDEESLVVHTPPPAPGAMDSMGFTLSPVATTGADAPPLPDNSGSGRRVVYDRAGQRVWAVSEDGDIIRSWLVTGSKYMNEQPGTHQVYSRSEMSTAWNGQAWLPQMIRYQKTDIGAIGFHAIPLHVSDNSPYQTTEELGQRLSGGCQRQHNLDSAFMWEFAQVGTTVVVT